MQGLFIQGSRPKSKKEVKEILASPNGAKKISAESTSMFGDDFGGPITDMKIGSEIHFVGPDPYRKRNFYGTILRKSEDQFIVK